MSLLTQPRVRSQIGTCTCVILHCLDRRTELHFGMLLSCDAGPVPVILCLGGSYTIHFNGTVVPEPPVSSFLKALEVWFSIFWVFSISYPPQLKNSCLFVEEYIFGQRCTVPGIVRHLAEKLFKR